MPWWKRSRAERRGDAPAASAGEPGWAPPLGPRYYLYVSDSKLDMLAGQIPRGRLDRLVADLQIDLKVVTVSLRDEPSEETRYSKLALVEAYLQEHGPVGTVDTPAAYFGGTMEMRWGVVANHVVYFTGYGEHTVVGLTGSRRHVVGEDVPQIVEWGVGSFPSSLGGMARALDLEDADAVDPDALRGHVEGAAARFLAPRQEVHFLARRLMHTPASGWAQEHFPSEPKYDSTLLGTPVYVALAD